MDLRVKRTKTSIANAFLELCASKPPERITVKELAALAGINKATFYLHYKDIFELLETLENYLFERVFDSIEHPNSALSEPKLFIKELVEGFIANKELIDVIFGSGRRNILAEKIESEVKRFIFEQYPQYKDNTELNISLTYMIKGCYYAYAENSEYGSEHVTAVIGEISEGVVGRLER